MYASVLLRLVALLLVGAVSGCASLYFHDAGAPPSPAPRYELAQWPYREYWTGIVFNGAKIGFSHLRIDPAGTDRYAIHSQAAFRLRFLGVDKQFQLTSLDVVRPDLTLERLQVDLNMDGARLKLTGEAGPDTLRVDIETGGNHHPQQLPLAQAIHPTSVIPLYPLLHGLEIGRTYAYTVYDGELQQLAEVEQTILAYELSELFEGPAFKLRTRLHGHDSTMWIAPDGLPRFELAMSGVLISALETEQQAKRYLISASLNKQDVLLDFSRVPTQTPISTPRQVTSLVIEFEGLDAAPSDARQRCGVRANAFRCEIDSAAVLPAAQSERERYLRPSIVVPSVDPRIHDQAHAIAGDTSTPRDIVARLLDWMESNIRKENVDAFSAVDVLERRRAECQGHSYLYTGFARALGVPTRIVNGLVYSDEYAGFLYHTWAESLMDGAWVAVDPIFNQTSADATHVKLIEGENAADLLPLLNYIGKIRARVIAQSRP